MNVSSVLSNWYNKSKRNLPWRNTKNPYIIWLSEIILQQTRVEQGLPYFEKFSEKFPTVEKLASAHEDKILKMWQGLGYYSRARNMHYTAKEIIKSFKGKFPVDYSELRKLKGVGDYTAAAISSFAYNKPHAVVDGNVYRFLSRYFGIKTPVDSSKGKKIFSGLAYELLDKKNPGLHNQAIMEFGAMQCKPANPDCGICPLISGCFAFKKNKIKQFPVKAKAQQIRARHFHYLVITRKDKVYLHKRTANDIWKNLYEFPLIETKGSFSFNQLMKTNEWQNIFGTSDFHIQHINTDCKHKLSHQTIYARFYEINLNKRSNNKLKSKYFETTFDKLEKYAVPVLIERFLKQRFSNLPIP
ncbi:MAG: A/G-specific adenine glycosylase [Bacteroidia bacterium]